MSETQKKFYWDESTIFHFRFEANYTSKKNVIKNIIAYVENECTIEENENESDVIWNASNIRLITDLINQVFNK